jgi:hypothetical protein
MKISRLAFLVPALLLLAPLSTLAKDVRFPEKTLPAFTFVLPDDWSAEPDTDGNLIMRNPNHMTSLVIFTGESADDLDVIAKEALQIAKAAPSPRKEPVEISGCKGFTYFSTMTNPSGVHINLEMSIVRIDPKHVASASLIMAENVNKADETNTRLVRNGLKLKTEE